LVNGQDDHQLSTALTLHPVPTHQDKVPNPESDEVTAVFYAFHVSGTEVSNSGVVVQNKPSISRERLRQMKVEEVDDELDLLNRVVDLVVELDPDILTGWEVQLTSWGYLEARARARGVYGFLTRNEILT